MLTSPKMQEYLHDQSYFNYMFPMYKQTHRTNAVLLSELEFPEGRNYFRVGHRFFYDSPPCHECFEVHNNWIVGTRAKTLRFQEHLMWMVDDDGYYSDPKRKYLMYANPAVLATANHYFEWESAALRNAVFLSVLTRRTLILPRFHANASFAAPFFSIYKVNLFTMYFHEHRESSFLVHPFVPPEVKASLSPWLNVDVKFTVGARGLLAMPPPEDGGVVEFDGSTPLLETWVRRFEEFSVVRLTSLYEPKVPMNLTWVQMAKPVFVEKMQEKAIVKKYEDNNIIS
jgi:hypothetical protein